MGIPEGRFWSPSPFTTTRHARWLEKPRDYRAAGSPGSIRRPLLLKECRLIVISPLRFARVRRYGFPNRTRANDPRKANCGRLQPRGLCRSGRCSSHICWWCGAWRAQRQPAQSSAHFRSSQHFTIRVDPSCGDGSQSGGQKGARGPSLARVRRSRQPHDSCSRAAVGRNGRRGLEAEWVADRGIYN